MFLNKINNSVERYKAGKKNFDAVGVPKIYAYDLNVEKIKSRIHMFGVDTCVGD